jgi:ABC-2 type transport system permease protein
LLSSVRPGELVFGKLIGVGVLSVLVVGAWLAGGAAVAASPLGAPATVSGVLFDGFGKVGVIAGAAGLFVLAFAMYGAALIALGACARDVPAAQNLSRPVFGLLLIIFFVALAQFAGMGDGALPELVLFPPFTPFVLLLARPGSIDLLHMSAGLGGMLATVAACAWIGSRALRGELRMRWPLRARRTPAVQPA